LYASLAYRICEGGTESSNRKDLVSFESRTLPSAGVPTKLHMMCLSAAQFNKILCCVMW